MDPKGQVAIVTGGASGLGAATARALAAAGAKVAVLDLNEKAAGEIAQEHRRHRGRLRRHRRGERDQRAGESAARRMAPARILVNCAGIGPAKRILGRDGPMPLADFEKVIEINLIGTFNMMRLVAADMSKLEPLADGERGVDRLDRVGRRLRRPDRPGGLCVVEGRRRRADAAGGARIRAVRHPRAGDRARHFRDADADGAAAGGAGFARRLGAVSEAARRAARICRRSCSHCVDNGYLNGEVIRLDGALRMAPR